MEVQKMLRMQLAAFGTAEKAAAAAAAAENP